jgi:hypothetical protein
MDTDITIRRHGRHGGSRAAAAACLVRQDYYRSCLGLLPVRGASYGTAAAGSTTRKVD